MSVDEAALRERLAAVKAQIAAACGDRAPPTLIAVSKGHPAEAIRVAYEAGHRDFGESYPQEWRRKASALEDLPALRWHFIGHLQRNKTQWVMGKVALHHTVNSMPGLDELARRAWSSGCEQDVLLQVNLSGEASKRGCAPEEAAAFAQVLTRAPGLRWRGLMTLPPQDDDPRRWFRQLRELRDKLAVDFASDLKRSGASLELLSMGMSGDFEHAIAEGATHLRVGTAIFGPRPTRP